MISPQTVRHNREFCEEKSLTATVLSDPGNAVAARYGLRFEMPEDLRRVYRQFGIDLPAHNDDDSWTLPLSARLIIDTEGIVRYAEIDADYTVRPEPEDTLKALQALAGR